MVSLVVGGGGRYVMVGSNVFGGYVWVGTCHGMGCDLFSEDVDDT